MRLSKPGNGRFLNIYMLIFSLTLLQWNQAFGQLEVDEERHDNKFGHQLLPIESRQSEHRADRDIEEDENEAHVDEIANHSPTRRNRGHIGILAERADRDIDRLIKKFIGKPSDPRENPDEEGPEP